jgi:hypothetical protein
MLSVLTANARTIALARTQCLQDIGRNLRHFFGTHAVRGRAITAAFRHADDEEYAFLLDRREGRVAAETRIAVEISVQHTG